MNEIKIDKHLFEILLEEQKIESRIAEMAKDINRDFKNQTPTILVVLKGAFVFAASLITRLNIDFRLEFISISSYEGEFKKDLTIKKPYGNIPKAFPVLVLEDIVESGETIDALSALLYAQGVNTLKVASLLFKPEQFKGEEMPDYIGFSIPNAFVVGYGMDYNDYKRGLNHIYQKKI